MALAATVDATTWGPRQWPMTRDAWKKLDAVATRLTREVIATDGYVTGRLDGESDAPSFVPNIVGQQLLRQLNTVRTVLERAVVLDAPEVAVIGHRVTLREADGSTSVYELVIPGDGDPRNGAVSVDSPVGSAILGRRTGDLVTITAPAETWSATVTGID